MKILKDHTFIFFSLALLALLACDEDETTRYTQTWDKEENRRLEFAIRNAPVLKLENYNGGFIIYGHNHKQRIDISANCRVESTDREKLESMLADIEIKTAQEQDTAYIWINTPVPKRDERYACGLNLFIPYAMPVVIAWSKSVIITNELDSLVHVRNAQSRILLARHRGSADLEAQSHINLELYQLWPYSFINAVTDSGDINMILPKSSDATILAQSFYHPIELYELKLDTFLRSYYTAQGIMGDGDASINLKTTYGTIRIRAD